MNQLAEELNTTLKDTCASRLLSDLGRRIYFPKGLLTQSAEATESAHRFNATIGMSYSGGEPMILDAVREQLPLLSSVEAVAYAPTGGVPALRSRWKAEILRKNPSLAGKAYSLPVVVPGLTAGISYAADLFVNPNDVVIIPDMNWPNYRLIMEERKMARLVTYPTFDAAGGFNLDGLERAIEGAASDRGKAIVILNFPNNPTGYSPTVAEADGLCAIFVRAAEKEIDVLVVADDAYFGLRYEPSLFAESIFARLAGLHRRIFAIKVDGSTKEDFVWGFRSGFITFAGGPDCTEAMYQALEKKTYGMIRSSVSSSTAPTQYVLLRAIEHPGYEAQKASYGAILEARYRRVKDFLAKRPASPFLVPFPFNSGYFMTFDCRGVNAEELRVRLLRDRGIGVISMQEKWLRVAFSSVDLDKIDQLFDEIYAEAAALGARR